MSTDANDGPAAVPPEAGAGALPLVGTSAEGNREQRERAQPGSLGANGVPVFDEGSAARRAVMARADRAARDDLENDLAEFLPQPYLVTDTYGAIRLINSAACELLGLALYQIEGRPLATLIPIEHRQQFRISLAASVRTGAREQWRTTFRTATGEVPVRLTVGTRNDAMGRPFLVRWLVQVEGRDGQGDEQHAPTAEEQAGLERAHLGRALPGLPPGAAWILSQASDVLASSFDYLLTLRSALQLALPWLGDWAILDLLSEGSCITRSGVMRVPTEDPEVARLLWRRPPSLGDSSDPVARVLCGGAAELIQDVNETVRAQLLSTSWGRDVVDRLKPRSWITVPLRARGRTIGALTFLTARSRRPLGRVHLLVAQQLADRAALAADNARLYEEATRANEAKSAFLAVMSHELRTPLTAIIGYTELLADGLFGPVSEQQQVQLGRVRESSEHLLRIIEEVLQYARLEARHDQPEMNDVELSSLIDQALTLVRPLAERKGIGLAVEQPAGRVRFRTDPGRLRQVLVNLLANAVKFTDAGEVRLIAAERREAIVVDVRDTGPGIPPAHLGRIFEPFWQADQRFTRPQPGSGLGLSVTKELVSLLGGGIDVRSTVGVGSTFTVWVPSNAVQGSEGAEERSPHLEPTLPAT